MTKWLFLIVSVALLLCTPITSSGQDAVAVSPDVYSVLFENDEVRLMEMVYAPGQRDAPHSHPKYAVSVMEGGTLRAHLSDGETVDNVVERGQTFLLDPVERHWAENVGDTRIRVIVIEFKR
jgi:quercetin dioxygenase-like cupin family protein